MKPTEHKLTELTFHLIVDSAPNAVVLVNEKGQIAYVNRHCETLFGYRAPELIGQPVEELLPDRFRHGHVALRRAYTEAPVMRRMGVGRELYARRKDGTEFPIEIGLNPLVLVDGTWVLATIIDISARKQLQDQFLKIVEAAPYAMVVVDEHGTITLVNRQATDMFGYHEDDMLGQKIEMLLPARLRGHHVPLRDGFLSTPQIRYMGAGRELLAVRKDGSEIQVEVGLNPMKLGDSLRVLASITDITKRKAQEDMRAKKEAAEAAYKAKGELLAIASHDLKNPLAAIAGLAEIMLEMKKAESSAFAQDVEFLQSIHEAASHMSDVVKDILASERIELQGLAFDETRVDLSALCAGLLRIDESVAMRKDITLVSEIEPGIAVRGNATRLREAFDNYVSNAIKYSPRGSRVTVTLATTADGTCVEFGVRDEGPGLTEDDKSKAFGKFKKLSAKPTGGESSTGLGLSIVKTIVELHEGTVGCDSRPGEGAYFWARLPRS